MILLNKDSWEAVTTKLKGKGLFAKKDLDPGIVVGDYLGKVVRTAEVDLTSEKGNFYLMYYHDQASIYPDLEKPGIHLVNHSCEPNLGFFTFQGHILFFTLRKIFAGEELSVNYMLSPKDSFCEPCNHICKCGSKFCTKSMHLFQERYQKWRDFQTLQEKKTKKKRISYNKGLPALESYPKLVPDHPIYSLFGTTTKPAKVLTDINLPTSANLRKLIRQSGKRLEFPNLNKRILAIEKDLVISEKM